MLTENWKIFRVHSPEAFGLVDNFYNIANNLYMKYIAIFVIALSLSVCSTTGKVKEEPFSVDFNSPKISLGDIEAQLERFLSVGGLKTNNFTAYYYPLEDAVCLQYKSDLTTYYQFWNKENRDAFLSALEQYKKDFTARNLNSRGSKKTREAYGSVQGFLIWQLHRFAIRASGNPEIRMGYDFKTFSKNRAAFFTFTQREIEFTNDETGNNSLVSPNIMIYFTITQADTLAALFDQQVLQSFREMPKSPTTELDIY